MNIWAEFMTPGEPDNRVKVYKADDPEKKLIRIEKPIPESFQEKAEMPNPEKEDDMPIKADVDWDPIMEEGIKLVNAGDSVYKASQKIHKDMKPPCSQQAVYLRLKVVAEQVAKEQREKQTPNPNPEEVGRQKPDQDAQEPASHSIAEEKQEVKGTDVPGPVFGDKVRIRVSYSELISGPGFNNQRATTEIEVEVQGDINQAYAKAWEIVESEVKRQLGEPVEDDDNDDAIPY